MLGQTSPMPCVKGLSTLIQHCFTCCIISNGCNVGMLFVPTSDVCNHWAIYMYQIKSTNQKNFRYLRGFGELRVAKKFAKFAVFARLFSNSNDLWRNSKFIGQKKPVPVTILIFLLGNQIFLIFFHSRLKQCVKNIVSYNALIDFRIGFL